MAEEEHNFQKEGSSEGYSELLITANASLIVMLFTITKLWSTLLNRSNPVLEAMPLSNLYRED